MSFGTLVKGITNAHTRDAIRHSLHLVTSKNIFVPIPARSRTNANIRNAKRHSLYLVTCRDIFVAILARNRMSANTKDAIRHSLHLVTCKDIFVPIPARSRTNAHTRDARKHSLNLVASKDIFVPIPARSPMSANNAINALVEVVTSKGICWYTVATNPINVNTVDGHLVTRVASTHTFVDCMNRNPNPKQRWMNEYHTYYVALCCLPNTAMTCCILAVRCFMGSVCILCMDRYALVVG